ncbi:MAG: UbiA family prenyltransferase [Candidatus Thermoplasmatota archaeon]|nr:UbiA family prenyltransferase [Candidatus Thermoplasmatota archaeon]
MAAAQDRKLAGIILTAIILRCLRYTYQIYGILIFAVLVCIMETGVQSVGLFKDIGIVFASVSLILLYSYFLNCYADARMDAIGGKQISGDFPKVVLLLLAIICLSAGIVINGLLARQNLAYNLFYLLSAPLGVLYSVEPFRLKTKGIWGPIADLTEVTIPAALVFSYFGVWTYNTALFLSAFCAINFIWILEHQLSDYDSDLASGEKTFAVSAGPEKTMRILASFYPMEAALTIILSAIILAQLDSKMLSAAGFAGMVILLLASAFLFRGTGRDQKIGNRPSIHTAEMFLILVVLPLLLAADLAMQFKAYYALIAITAIAQLKFYCMAISKASTIIGSR